MSEFKTIAQDEWYEQYIPTSDEPLEHFPDGIVPNHLWTELECDGVFTISSGNHFVNRTGRYWITVKPHQFDVDVEDDEN